MKVKLHLKTPDVVEEAVRHEMSRLEDAGVDEDTRLNMEEELRECLDKFFNYGESVTIEVCTDTNKAEVLRAR
jgi:hypothetical protein